MKNNIKEFIEAIPKAPESINKSEHHVMLQDYLDEALPEEVYDPVKPVDKLVSRAYIYPDIWLGRAIKEILQNPDDDILLKETKLFYFLEEFYSKCKHYSSLEQTEELFNLAIECSLESRDVEDFLAGVYPDYIDIL